MFDCSPHTSVSRCVVVLARQTIWWICVWHLPTFHNSIWWQHSISARHQMAIRKTLNSIKLLRFQLTKFDFYLPRKKQNTIINRCCWLVWSRIHWPRWMTLNAFTVVKWQPHAISPLGTHTFRCCCCFRSNVFISLNSAAIFSSLLSEHTKRQRKKKIRNNTQNQSHGEHTTQERRYYFQSWEYIWPNQNTILLLYLIWFFSYFCMWMRIKKRDYLHHIEHNNQAKTKKNKKLKIKIQIQIESQNSIFSKSVEREIVFLREIIEIVWFRFGFDWPENQSKHRIMAPKERNIAMMGYRSVGE